MAVVSVFKDISRAMYSLSDAFSQNLVLPFVLNVEPLAMDCVIRFCSTNLCGLSPVTTDNVPYSLEIRPPVFADFI